MHRYLLSLYIGAVKVRSNNPLLIALCMIALLVTQLFGANRGYVCLCSGEPIAVETVKCTASLESNCHGNGALHTQNDSGCDEEHLVVKTQLDLSTSRPAPALDAPTFAVVWIPYWTALLQWQTTNSTAVETAPVRHTSIPDGIETRYFALLI